MSILCRAPRGALLDSTTMSICTYGSSASGTAPADYWITGNDAKNALGTGWVTWVFLWPLLLPQRVHTATFCATEPKIPAYPGDVAANLMFVDPASFALMYQWISDVATYYAWQTNCVCNPPPGGCASVMTDAQWAALTNTGGAGGNYHWNLLFTVSCTGQYCYGIETELAVGASAAVYLFDVTAGTTVYHETLTLPSGRHQTLFSSFQLLTSGHSYEISLRQDATALQIKYNNSGGSPASQTCFTFPQFIYGSLDDGSDNATYSGWLGVAPLLCVAGGTPPPPVPPPTPAPGPPPTGSCTTIADLCAILTPLQNTVATILGKLTWLSNRAEPFTWIAGTTTSGLTGSGFLSVHDAIGAIVSVTTIPGGWGSNYETPRRRIPQLGMIAAGDGTNEDFSRPIHYAHQVFLWHAPWATQLVYNFANGVTSSLTPIFPES